MAQSNKTNLYAGQIILGGKFSIDSTGLGSTASISLNSQSTVGIATDAVTGAVNIGTGALARTITIGNVTGATAIVLNSGTGGIAVPKTTVTQLTSPTTAVTANSVSGVITTVADLSSITAASAAEFTVNNSLVTATDRVLVSIVDYAGTYATNGLPVVSVDTIGAGSFKIVISNVHAANALSGAGALKISFVVLK